jgi:hypothetical protein
MQFSGLQSRLDKIDEVFLIAVDIAKVPSVPRQILKNIPGHRTRPAGTIERNYTFKVA